MDTEAKAGIEAGAATDDSRIDRRLWQLGGIMALGGFASLLDATIVNIAVGTLGTAFDAPLATVQWVVTGYLLALCGAIPLSGWAAERFGAKQVLIFAQLVFTVGSLLSGLAWSAESLIVFRIVQGIGGGLAVTVGQALVAQAAGPKRLGRLMAVLSVPMLLAPVVGPSLGGVLIDRLDWRWIFFINVPLGLLTVLLIAARVDNVMAPSSPKLDVVGLLLLPPGLAALLYGLSEAGSDGGFAGGRVIGGLVVGVVLLGAFCVHALRTRTAPMLDLRLFRDRDFASGAVAGVLLSAAMFGAMIPLPLYFQVVRGESVLRSALLLLPQSIGYLLAVAVVAPLTARIGARRLTLIAIPLAVLGTVPFALLGAGAGAGAGSGDGGGPAPLLLGAAMVVRGFGFGASMLPTMTAAYTGMAATALPQATSAFTILQRIGASVGTAVLAVVLQQASGASGDGLRAADAFGTSFWWALSITVLALVPSAFLTGGRDGARSRATPAEVEGVQS
ncbi:DHA2 family efflux MFS transporter permease subunit [Streptomyces sp. NPDC057137]|uniref:DHA2 family efflux MFS transporter permease subunit n=1 Tax=Streptomyces sp. NPDC057137 TaxID=3346030 RepID=UPI0036422AEE